MKEYVNEEAAEEYEEMISRRAVGELDLEKGELNMYFFLIFFRELSDVKVYNDSLRDELNDYNMKIADVLKKIEAAKLAEKNANKKFGFRAK